LFQGVCNMPRIGAVILIAVVAVATIYALNKFTASGVAGLGK